MRLIVLLILTKLLLTIDLFAQVDQCKDVLKFVYDYSKTTSTIDQSLSFVNWYKLHEIQSYAEAKNLGISFGFNIDDIMASFGLTKGENDFMNFQRMIESYSSQDASLKTNFEKVLSTINKNVIDAWTKCMDQPGLKFWVVQNADPTIFTVFCKYRAVGNFDPTISTFNFTPRRVTINEGAFFDKNGKLKNIKIKGAGFHQTFKRIGKGSISIDITATDGDGLNFFLPAVTEPKPIVSFSATPSHILIGQSTQLQWSATNAKKVTIDNNVGEQPSESSITVRPAQTTTYTLTATNPEGSVSTQSITVEVDKMLDRDYYVRIFHKNNGGWLQLLSGNDRAVHYSDNIGFFDTSTPYVQKLNINSPDYVICHIERWRDGSGNPGPRPFMEVLFQVFAVAKGTTTEIPLIPTIQETQTWYGDTFDFAFRIDPNVASIELFNANQVAWDNFVHLHH
jgi:hypothetical protein